MASDLLYIDSNVLILAFEAPGGTGDPARRILEAVERDRLGAVTSELTLSEVLVRPIRDQDEDLAAGYRQMLTTGDGFEVVAIDRPILEAAAVRRASNQGLKLPDAIHLATADRAGCTVVVSGDARLPVAPGCRRLALTEDDVFRFLESLA